MLAKANNGSGLVRVLSAMIGTDCASASCTLTFAAGETEKTVAVGTHHDGAAEDDEGANACFDESVVRRDARRRRGDRDDRRGGATDGVVPGGADGPRRDGVSSWVRLFSVEGYLAHL